MDGLSGNRWVSCGLPSALGIGDCALKLGATYTTHLFRHLAYFGGPTLYDGVAERNRTQPYISADPSIRCIDLGPLWHRHPVVMIYSDGVDHLVNGCHRLHPQRPRDIVPSRTVAVLLQDSVDVGVPVLLGHQVDLRWTGQQGNRAVDVLGNLIGCTDERTLQTIMDQRLLADHKARPRLYIDDTTLLLGFLTTDSV